MGHGRIIKWGNDIQRIDVGLYPGIEVCSFLAMGGRDVVLSVLQKLTDKQYEGYNYFAMTKYTIRHEFIFRMGDSAIMRGCYTHLVLTCSSRDEYISVRVPSIKINAEIDNFINGELSDDDINIFCAKMEILLPRLVASVNEWDEYLPRSLIKRAD